VINIKNMMIETTHKSLLDDLSIVRSDEISDHLSNWWLPDVLNVSEPELLYIKRVGNHIEIGHTKIELIQ